MSPSTLILLSWLAIAGVAWSAVMVDRTASPLFVAICAACAIVFTLLQSIAFSRALGREMEAILAVIRGEDHPDGGAP